MNISLQKILAVSFVIMGLSVLTEDMPPEFIQHLLGLVFLTIAGLLWRLK